MAEVIWSKAAVSQLERAIRYIRAERGNFYANHVLSKILQSTGKLRAHSKRGQIEPLLKHKNQEYRYIVVWSYKIVYCVIPGKVIISRVFHTAQKPSKLRRR